jgi:hypothetical protein
MGTKFVTFSDSQAQAWESESEDLAHIRDGIIVECKKHISWFLSMDVCMYACMNASAQDQYKHLSPTIILRRHDVCMYLFCTCIAFNMPRGDSTSTLIS